LYKGQDVAVTGSSGPDGAPSHCQKIGRLVVVELTQNEQFVWWKIDVTWYCMGCWDVIILA